MRYTSLFISFFLFLNLGYASELKKKKVAEHDEMVNVVCFSNNGNWLISGSNDNTFAVYDVKKGKEIKRITAHSIGVTDAVFTPDDAILITCGRDKQIKIWDVANWKLKKTLSGHQAQINSLCISPDASSFFSAADDGKIIKWSLKNFNEEKSQNAHDGRVISISISENGSYLVSTSGDKISKSSGNLKIWDIDLNMIYELNEETFAIQKARLSKKGSMVLYAGNFNEIILLKWKDDIELAKKEVTQFGINALALNGLEVWGGSTYNGTLIHWNIGENTTETQVHKNSDINSISVNESKVATGGTDGKVYISE